MTKFLIEMKIITEKNLVYEVESENRETLDKDLKDFSPADLGDCVSEEDGACFNCEITDIREKIDK